MNRFKKFALILVLPLIIAGCASTPAKKSYILSTDTTAINVNAGNLPSVMISEVRSIGRLSTDMLYSRNTNEIASFVTSEWVAPPAQMLQAAITQDLEARNLFQYVVMAPNSVTAAYRLDLTILEMRQYFPSDVDSHIVLKVQARLINNSNNKIARTFNYHKEEKSPHYNAEGGVEAYNKALNQISSQLAQDLSQTLRNQR